MFLPSHQIAILSWAFPKINLPSFLKARLAQNLSEAIDLAGFSQHKDFLQKLWKSPQVQSWIQFLEKKSVHFVTYGDELYPTNLCDVPSPPLILTYLGAPVWSQKEGLALVGSRNPSALALQWMERYLPPFLSRQNIIVVSGGARGIDQKAHWLALTHRQPTIAFMPVGLQYRYPPDFHQMEQEILLGGGAILSQFPPDQGLWKSNFVRRNWLIAGLSRGVLIVEAHRRSGTMLTARWAVDLHRPLATLPSSPMLSTGLGNLDLIMNGAQPLRDEWDLEVFWNLSSSTGGRR